MLGWSQCPAVERAPGKISGDWIFKGRRVPVRALFENIEDGAGIDDFLARDQLATNPCPYSGGCRGGGRH